jgi:hypothetical protein
MKKFSLSIALLMTTLSHAGIDDRIDDLEWEMKQVSVYTPQDTIGASFAKGQPDVLVQGEKLFLLFDVLYWHAKVGGTEYAYSLQPSIIQTGSIILPQANGHTKYNDFSWEWGLKAGFGINLPHDGWDVFAQYTWFKSNTTNSSSKAPPSALMPLRLFSTMLAIKAKSFFDLDYQNVDVNLGKSYFLSKMVMFRPFISVKSAWIDLNQNVTYTASSLNDFLFPGTAQTVGHDFKSKNSNNFWGIGPRIGVDSKWFLGNGFSLFSDIAGALLYGYFKTLLREKIPPNNVQFADGGIIKNRHKFHLFVPFVQMYGGLAWQGYVNHDKQYITLKFGYEVQYYWRVNQMVYTQDVSAPVGSFSNRASFDNLSEDVMFYGITGEFKLDF